MNLQCSPRLPFIRVLMVNPLVPSTQMVIAKIMSGVIFGSEQDVELTLLVYANEKEQAEEFKAELRTLAFGCVTNIEVSSNLPKITDADVFCFMTNFKNPNKFVPDNFMADDQFDVLYLLLKIANSLADTAPPVSETKENENNALKQEKPKLIKRRPIIVADGIVTLDILKSMSKDIPSDVFFCSTPIEALTDIVLGDFLRVKTHEINSKCIWAANHEIFHVEFNRPLITTATEDTEKTLSSRSCLMGPCGRPYLDYVQFNETWMKKNFMERVLDLSLKNPYGQIYKASEFSATLTAIWAGQKSKTPVCLNAGVISDGSLDTAKGYPYVLPIEIAEECWKVSEKFKDDAQLHLEIKRINKVVRQNHFELVTFCQKFLEENVMKLQFMPEPEQSLSTFSFSKMSEENVFL